MVNYTPRFTLYEKKNMPFSPSPVKDLPMIVCDYRYYVSVPAVRRLNPL
jgi:hypothetical protein